MAETKEAAKGREESRRLYLIVGIGLGGSAVLWLAGFLLLRLFHIKTGAWNAVWGLAGISFLSAVLLPLPGATTAALTAVKGNLFLGTLGVLGAAAGGTIAAALLMGLGGLGRRTLAKHSHSKWRKKVLEWSKKAAQKWTYGGVFVLLCVPFIPRSPVLYAASLAELKPIPYLITVFAGTLVRNLIVLGVVVLPFLH
ncbi:MAG TPA: VTT domain-containing protein [Candidatus Thermoplasmatota archaeon]|nr:VTT domain-containing protein [Candidatus Thermoplasmatota archaeon]